MLNARTAFLAFSSSTLALGLAQVAHADEAPVAEPPAPTATAQTSTTETAPTETAPTTPTSGGDGLPVPYVERPLTLPEMMLAPEFGASLSHLEFAFFGGSIAVNAINLGAGASFGIIDDLTAYVVPLVMTIGTSPGSDPQVYYGTFRLGAIYRFFKSEVADIGAQAEFGATGVNDVIHLTARLPILLRLADVVRIDTGLAISGFFPVNGGDPAGGIASMSNHFPSPIGLAGAGVPVDVAFQVAEPVFLGLNTGIGLADFETAEDTFFSPLGLFVGGTVPAADGPLMDLRGSFSFPYFLVSGDPEPPFTNLWQVGLDARAYIDLGG